jgi:hypothetical protein
MTTVREDLAAILGTPLDEGYTTSAKVLTMPSGVTKELATQAIEQLDLTQVLKDIGVIVAREIANELEAMNLRPADYVALPDMPQMVASMVAGELASAPEEFVQALIEQLKLRG